MILYKYYPCNEYTFRALSELGFWCSPASNMNDPFDCLWQLDTKFDELERTSLVTRLTDFMVGFKTPKIQEQIVDEVSRSFAEINLDDQEIQKIINEACSNPNNLVKNLTDRVSLHRNATIKEFCFCSLSKDYTNILMWSHYANSHKGIVVGVEFEDFYIDRKISIQKVRYSNKLPPFNISKYSKAESFNNARLQMSLIFSYLSHKTLNWKYEKEYRIWYRNQPSYFKYDQSQLKSVYFGYKCPEETKTLVKSILRGHGVSDEIYNDIKIEIDPQIRLTI